MSEAIYKILCSIKGLLAKFEKNMEREYTGTGSTLSSVRNTLQVPQKIAGRNPKRVELIIHNAGDKDMFIAPDVGEVGRQLYTLRIAPNDAVFLNSHNYAHLYKGDIVGFWEKNSAMESKAMITEFYIDI